MSDAIGGVEKPRAQFRNLGIKQILSYRLPLAGIVSILHRVSGLLMFLVGIPLVLYLFQLSLTSELSYDAFTALTSGFIAKLVILVLFWAFFHHLCAGIRFLLLDIHVGTEKAKSVESSKIVFAASGLLTLVAVLKLFGAI